MTAKVSFKITTYWKRPRNEPGLTSRSSRRLQAGEALDWIVRELPEEAITMTHDHGGEHDAVTLRIDWTKVPEEIRAGT